MGGGDFTIIPKEPNSSPNSYFKSTTICLSAKQRQLCWQNETRCVVFLAEGQLARNNNNNNKWTPSAPPQSTGAAHKMLWHSTGTCLLKLYRGLESLTRQLITHLFPYKRTGAVGCPLRGSRKLGHYFVEWAEEIKDFDCSWFPWM